jgi:hypothetical protein
VVNIRSSDLTSANQLPLAYEFSNAELGSKTFADFEKRQLIGKQLADILVDVHCNQDHLEKSEQLIDKILSAFEHRLSEIADAIPEISKAVDAFIQLKPEFIKAGTQILESDQVRDLVKLSVLGFLPSHADSVATNPFLKILQISLGSDQLDADSGPIKNFVTGITSDLTQIELRYRKLAAYSRFVPERLLDVLVNSDEPVNKQTVFSGIKSIFDNDSSLLRHFQLLESTERQKVREVINSLGQRLQKLAQEVSNEIPLLNILGFSEQRDLNAVTRLIIKQFSELANDLAELGFSYRKQNILKLKEFVFADS